MTAKDCREGLAEALDLEREEVTKFVEKSQHQDYITSYEDK